MTKAFGTLLLIIGVANAAELEQPPARPALRINADLLIAVLKSNMVIYSNHVFVFDPPSKTNDPPTTLKCRELTAKRDNSGKIESIMAEGKVEIDQGDNHARGGLAVYSATNEQMVLTGAFDPADTNAWPQPSLFSSQGLTYGERIIYDRRIDRLFIDKVTTKIPSAALSTLNQNSTNSTATNRISAPRRESPGP